MSIKIMAVKNTLPSRKNPYFIRGQWSDVVEEEDLIDIMAKGRTTLSRTDIVAVIALMKEEVTRLVTEGKYVKTMLGAFYPGVSGSLASLDENFEPSVADNNHDVHVYFRMDRTIEQEVRAGLRTIRTTKVDKTVPLVFGLTAIAEDEANKVGLGNLLEVSGVQLKFDPKDKRLGVFLVDGAGVETRATAYAVTEPTSVILQVPPTLTLGDYTVLVRTMPKGKIREGVGELPLQVVG